MNKKAALGQGQQAESVRRLADELEELLPQTQCRKCGFSGCRPYAEAMATGSAKVDLCIPGGNDTARLLAEKTGKDINGLQDIPDTSYQVAEIDEERCVGCFKCIEACPVDAIVGAHGLMHTVMTELCTGCGLCVAPCPVDCILMVDTDAKGDGQAVHGGIVGNAVAAKAAARLKKRALAKAARPSLRTAETNLDLEPQELARRAVNRAKRRARAANT